MKIVNTGSRFDIYENSLKVYDVLPSKAYIIRFQEKQGFYLEEFSDIEIKESKIYGVHIDKVNKVLSSFEKMNRNLGVILSGDKGIGKSLFAKLLSVEGIKRNIPVIIADKYYPGIASYIDEIKQEVIILFDEYEKTFSEMSIHNGNPQTEMLTLFDGLSQGKKLFIITCNQITNLNEFLINRPGRFHYHFRFNYPSAEDIRVYLQDKLDECYFKEIDKIIGFSRMVKLNYDCLRSIAFEVNQGYSFEEAIQDLNIINLKQSRYDIKLYFKDGYMLSKDKVYINAFDTQNIQTVWIDDCANDPSLAVQFKIADRELVDCETGSIKITSEHLELNYDYCGEEFANQIKKRESDYLLICMHEPENLNYKV